MKMDKAFVDSAPVTVEQYNRLVQEVAKQNPKVAQSMVDDILDGISVQEFAEFARQRGGDIVSDSGALVRQAIQRNVGDDVSVFTGAGYNAVDSGRDVWHLTGDGIRLSNALFDPTKSASRNLLAGVPGVPFVMPSSQGGELY